MTALNDITDIRQKVNESVTPSEMGLHTRLCEDVESHGLDPDVYLAVIEAELGKAGVVNKNRRIYPQSEFVRENMRLSTRLNEGEFVDGELGHPNGGPTFSVPARLIEVKVEMTDSVVATSFGKFGILNTSNGKDVLTLFRAGMPVGVSSRGEGIIEMIELDEDSEYASANPDYMGETVAVVKEFLLDRYDLVRVPSAGTHLTKEGGLENPSATESVEVHKMANDNSVAEATIEEVQTRDNASDEVVAKEAALESDILLSLSDAQKNALARIVEGITLSEDSNTDDELAQEISALREQMEVDRYRSQVNEAEYQALRDEVKALREERAARTLSDALTESVFSLTNERRFGKLVKAALDELVEEKVIQSTEACEKHAARLFAMLEAAVTPTVAPVEQEANDIVEDEVAEPVEKVEESALNMDQRVYDSIKALMVKDRARVGG